MKEHTKKNKNLKKEKLKSVLGFSLGFFTGISIGQVYKLSKENYPLFGYNEENIIIVKDNSELDQLNMEQVTFQDVRNTLSNNDNIKGKYKDYILEYIDRLEERLPDVDLRILNKNLETLDIKVLSPDEWTKEKLLGYYNYVDNLITLKSEYKTLDVEKRVIFHELTHVTNSATYEKMKVNNQYYLVNKTYQDSETNYGKGTMEAMTEIISDYLLSSNYTEYFQKEKHNYFSYAKEANTVYQLLKISDDYNIYDYFNGDIYKLEDYIDQYDLKEILRLIDLEETTDQEKEDLYYYQSRILEERFKKILNDEKKDELYSYRKIKEITIVEEEDKIEIIDEIYNNSFIEIERIDDPIKQTITYNLINNNKIETKNIESSSRINIDIYDGDNLITNSNPERLFFYNENEKYNIGYIESTYIPANNIMITNYYSVINNEEVNVTDNDIIYLDEFLDYYIGINNKKGICYNIEIDISKINEDVNKHLNFEKYLKLMQI